MLESLMNSRFLAGSERFVDYPEAISLTTPLGRCCSSSYFRAGGDPPAIKIHYDFVKSFGGRETFRCPISETTIRYTEGS